MNPEWALTIPERLAVFLFSVSFLHANSVLVYL